MAHTNWTTLAETRAGGVVAQLRQYELPTPVEMTVRETQPVISMMMPPYPVERLGRYEGAGADYHGLGNIVFTPAAADCQFRGDGGRPVSISCLFDPALFDRVVPIGEGWSRSRLAATLDIGGTAGGAIDRLLRRMAEELRAPGFAADIMVEGLGLATLAELARFLRRQGARVAREWPAERGPAPPAGGICRCLSPPAADDRHLGEVAGHQPAPPHHLVPRYHGAHRPRLGGGPAHGAGPAAADRGRSAAEGDRL